LQEFIESFPDTLIIATPPLPIHIAEAIADIVSSMVAIESVSRFVMDN